MKVRYFAYLRDDAGVAEEPVDGPASVPALLAWLAERHQEPLRGHLLASDGEVSPDIFILVNGRHLHLLQGLATPLSNTDEVALIPISEAG